MSTRKIGSRGLLVDMTASALAERICQLDGAFDIDVLNSMTPEALGFILNSLKHEGAPPDLREAKAEQHDGFIYSKHIER